MFDIELKELLESWGFGHLFPFFTAEEITVKRLSYVTEVDLTYIFRNSKLGEKIEFRHHLTEWKRKSGCEKCMDADLEGDDFGKAQSSSSSCTLKNIWTCNKVNLDLDLILSEHPTGNYVQRALNEGNNLNDATRKILIEAIVTYIIKNKVKPTRSDFERISSDIESKFNDDKKIYYNNVGPRAAGRLYDKYYNTLKKLKKCGEIFDSSAPKVAQNHEITISYEEENEAYEWLKVNSEPWPEVLEKWRKCYKPRREDILSAEGQDAVYYVLNQWPQFANHLGHSLVEIDFNLLYPLSTSLTQKWEPFRNKIIPILNSKLTDSIDINYLEQVSSQAEGSDLLLALLLHVLMRPNTKRRARDQNFTKLVKESQRSFIIQGLTNNDVEKDIELLRTSLYNRGESLHPIILAVGQNLSCSKYYLLFDDIKYSLFSFLNVFDICFKLFHVLHLKYPSDCFEFWMFVQKYFYGIHLEDDKVSSNTLCLISDLR